MSEEVPFKSIRVTLSEEAVRILEDLRQRGYFRSDSMTIEECIRAVYAISNDMGAVASMQRGKGEKVPVTEQLEGYRRVVMRLARFIPRESLVSE